MVIVGCFGNSISFRAVDVKAVVAAAVAVIVVAAVVAVIFVAAVVAVIVVVPSAIFMMM